MKNTDDFTLELKEEYYTIQCTTHAAAETLKRTFGLESSSLTFKLNHSEVMSLLQGKQLSVAK